VEQIAALKGFSAKSAAALLEALQASAPDRPSHASDTDASAGDSSAPSSAASQAEEGGAP
jgi:hypothetical protein